MLSMNNMTSAHTAEGGGLRAWWWDFALVARLAFVDLIDDRLQTLCVIIAITAVSTPLLVLAGLRVGLIESLRAEMVEDPVFREITPTRTQNHETGFFKRLAQRDDVAFILPHILAGASVISVREPASGRLVQPNLIPTGVGDPLLAAYGVQDLAPELVAISTPMAEALNVTTGSQVDVLVRRTVFGRSEEEVVTMTVVGTLPRRAEGRPAMFAPANFVLDVETYREGEAVPARGWSGKTRRPLPSFDGAIVLTPQPLSIEAAALARGYTGLTGQRPFDAARFERLMGLPAPEGQAGTEFYAEQATVGLPEIIALEDRLRSHQAIVLPYASVGTLSVTLDESDVRETAISANGLRDWQKARFPAPPPWGSTVAGAATADVARILLPEGWAGATARLGQTVTLIATGGREPVSVPVTVVGTTPMELPVVPVSLLGMLRTAEERLVRFNPDSGELVMEPTGFRGFRLYARSIDDVAALAEALEGEGVPVRSQEAAIERVKRLDRVLSQLFLVICILSGLAGVAVVTANSLASVSRKTADLGMLRLLGFSKRTLVWFPMCQLSYVAVAAVSISMFGFFLTAALVNGVLTDDLELTGDLCHLSVEQLGMAASLVFGLSAFAGLGGAGSVLRIDPREALRVD
jgi:putative ABC transport system permease protein